MRFRVFVMLSILMLVAYGAAVASAQDRPPRPDPVQLYSAGSFDSDQFRDEKLFAGRDTYFLFPHRYERAKWRVRFRMFYMSPHARLPRPDGEGWFMWPFRNRPPAGCEWYRVPTRRREVTGQNNERVYRYAAWRRLHLCFE